MIGLDLGTTNAKAVVYDLIGNVVAQASVSYSTYFPHPGWAEQRPTDWLEALSTALSKVTTELDDRRKEIAGIGLSAHGPGLILVNKFGQPILDTSPTWQDERCLAQGKWLLEHVGPEWIGLGMPLTGFPAKLLWAIQEQQEIVSRASYALGIKDFITGWLTGQFVTEPSSGPGSNEWYKPVFKEVNWPIEKLAEVRSPTSVAGKLVKSLASRFGLTEGLPVVIGMNDGACATLASGAVHSGDVIITLATNGVVRLILERPISPKTRLENALFCWPYLENFWVAGGQTKSGASSLEWLARIIHEDYREEAIAGVVSDASYSPIGSRGVIFIPYLMGRGSPKDDPNATGAFMGLTLSNNRADMVRAVLEGVGLAITEIFEIFYDMKFPINRIFITGGGARSKLWRQILADMVGKKLSYMETDSALGAAIVAAMGLHLHKNFHSAVSAMSHPQGEVWPIPENQEKYGDLMEKFRQLRDVTSI